VPAAVELRVRRQPERGRYARADVEAVLDAVLVAHVAFVSDGRPYCVPFLQARIGDNLFIHGAGSSRAIRVLAAGAPACVAMTAIDGLVLARAAFDHSANYRSAMVFGCFHAVAASERAAALEAFTNKLVPGRWDEVRAPSARELRGTAILALPLEQASVKLRSRPPEEAASDATAAGWAGVIPLATTYGAPERALTVDGEIPLPASVQTLTGRTCH
jgi:uncharacterized protein